MNNQKSQAKWFKEAASAVECNEDEACWYGLKRVVKRNPMPEKSE